jgi:hypothetical protein
MQTVQLCVHELNAQANACALEKPSNCSNYSAPPYVSNWVSMAHPRLIQ